MLINFSVYSPYLPRTDNSQEPRNDHMRERTVPKGDSAFARQCVDTRFAFGSMQQVKKATDFAIGNKLQDISKKTFNR
jgi:hypothetical protein